MDKYPASSQVVCLHYDQLLIRDLRSEATDSDTLEAVKINKDYTARWSINEIHELSKTLIHPPPS